MKTVSAILLIAILAVPSVAFGESSGEILMGLANQWANQPRPTTIWKSYQPPAHQPTPDARANQGLSYQERVIMNQMMQRGNNDNSYNYYYGDDDE